MPKQKSFYELSRDCGLSYYHDFLQKHWSFERMTTDKDEWEVVEHSFNKSVPYWEAVQILLKMEQKGEVSLLESARRALEWLAANPDAPEVGHRIVLPIYGREHHSEDYGKWDVWFVPFFGRKPSGEREVTFMSSENVDVIDEFVITKKYSFFVLKRKQQPT